MKYGDKDKGRMAASIVDEMKKKRDGGKPPAESKSDDDEEKRSGHPWDSGDVGRPRSGPHGHHTSRRRVRFQARAGLPGVLTQPSSDRRT